jgi:hypothetical protein
LQLKPAISGKIEAEIEFLTDYPCLFLTQYPHEGS